MPEKGVIKIPKIKKIDISSQGGNLTQTASDADTALYTGELTRENRNVRFHDDDSVSV